jgi:hypothetical protein
MVAPTGTGGARHLRSVLPADNNVVPFQRAPGAAS